ncbi:MAG: methyltransferase domain-containing protein [Myxococcales bacterium]|nr:methyltransferase domain-containing protein [Myxococcales bacterium]MCC6898724.1 methyltransferase domain-containing protein [Polyangiaceae bacterium]
MHPLDYQHDADSASVRRSGGGQSGATTPRGRTDEESRYYAFSQRAYAIFAYVYDAVVFPFQRLRQTVADTAAVPPDARLLDVATGTGAQAFAFARKAREVVGIDLSRAMLRVARRKNRFANVAFEEADAADMPFADESFDASCVSFALHEMPASVRQRVLGEMARVTAPGGSLIVVDYALPRNRVVRFFGCHLIELFEHATYASFVRSDLDAALQQANIAPLAHRSALAGLAKITVGRRGTR